MLREKKTYADYKQAQNKVRWARERQHRNTIAESLYPYLHGKKLYCNASELALHSRELTIHDLPIKENIKGFLEIDRQGGLTDSPFKVWAVVKVKERFRHLVRDVGKL